jgi:hypothetical protein
VKRRKGGLRLGLSEKSGRSKVTLREDRYTDGYAFFQTNNTVSNEIEEQRKMRGAVQSRSVTSELSRLIP